MKKQTLIIAGGSMLITVILSAIWLISFLDIPGIRPTVTDSPQSTNNTEEFGPNPTQVVTNGQVMASTEDDTEINQTENTSLIREMSLNDIPPGWEKTDWHPNLPIIDTQGEVLAVKLTQQEIDGWMAIIDKITTEELTAYAEKLKQNGWEVETSQMEGQNITAINAVKENWQAGLLYNPQVNQAILSINVSS